MASQQDDVIAALVGLLLVMDSKKRRKRRTWCKNWLIKRSMGVRGLTTFIENQENKYMKSHKLHNCTILLDGNSIASQLYISSKTESAFGGDYDKFANHVKEFFKVLQKCEIKPLVVFDGGYEERKLNTVFSRIKDKFTSSQCAQPLTGSINFPLFMRIVFREVLSGLQVPFAQSDFEADDEIAAIARQLGCPVLSYDSDFYIYNVLYIPFPFLCLQPVALENDSNNGNSKPSYYLNCKMYNVDVFIESFGGLNKTMLPLLATLLGNDYIERSVFAAFYTNLKIPKGKTNPLQRRIKAVIEWLRNETFESAVEKILSRMKKRKRKHVIRQIKKIVNGYVKCSSLLSEHLKINSSTKSNDDEISCQGASCDDGIIEHSHEKLEYIVDKIESSVLEDNSDNEDNSTEFSGEDSEDECPAKKKATLHHNENDNVGVHCNKLPSWLLKYSREGKVQSCIMDIVSLKQYFFIPQVEDLSLPSAHLISIKILSAIVGLLFGVPDQFVRYWTRNGSKLNFYYVEPIVETRNFKFPQIDEVLQIPESTRRSILLEVSETTVDVNDLPDEWHLFIVSTIFWIKHMKQPVATECHMFTMVMCLICIYTLDLHIGVHRNKQTFLKKHKYYLNKIIENRNKEKAVIKQSSSSETHRTIQENFSTKTGLQNVSREDCAMMFESIVSHHHLNEQIKVKPKVFNLTTVHAFSQFQSCLYHIMVLNSVLGFPFKEPIVSHLFSGTFTYNMYTNLANRNDVDSYLDNLFQNCPSLFGLYKVLVNFLKSALCDTGLCKNPLKKQRKRKKCTKSFKPEMCLNDAEEKDEFYMDENNRFSTLSSI